MQKNVYKLIGVQSNHGVEYFGGPAAPTLRFPHNQRFLHNQRFPHNQHSILMAATSLSRWWHQQKKRTCSQNIVIARFASQEVSYGACRQRLLEKWAFYDQFSRYVHSALVHLKIYHSPCLVKKSWCQKFGEDGFIIENSELLLLKSSFMSCFENFLISNNNALLWTSVYHLLNIWKSLPR